MPELPEVETIRLQLDKALKGLRITEVEVLNKKSFVGPSFAADFAEASTAKEATAGKDVRGVRVVGVKRRGKITLIELENNTILAIHLKLTGQLIYREKDQGDKMNKVEQKGGPFEVKELPNKFTRVIISFDPPSSCKAGLRRASKLYFNDLRMFGWVRVIRPAFVPTNVGTSAGKDLGTLIGLGLEKLGPEANDEKEFTLEYFRNILAKSHKPIKILIMDQEKLAGVGNIYANEALFMARILPTRKASELSEEDIKILRESILDVLYEAIKHKGSSDKDEAYRQITGEKGTHQNYILVYGKGGQKCPKCGGTIKRMTLGGRGTFYCEKCQK